LKMRGIQSPQTMKVKKYMSSLLKTVSKRNAKKSYVCCEA
jgi:hypothetical protein